MDILISLNKYHGEFVDKTGDEYNLPVVDLDRLRKTVFKRMQKINVFVCHLNADNIKHIQISANQLP